MSQKILILGIGNILFGDEGIGVHLAHYLKRNFSFSLAWILWMGGQWLSNSFL